MSRVPGTFKEPQAVLRRDHSASGAMAESLLHNAGAILAERWSLGFCTVMLAREPLGPGGSWRWHLSISHPRRYPTWDEIKTVVYSLDALADVVMAQVLGPVGPGEWVNVSENWLPPVRDPGRRVGERAVRYTWTWALWLLACSLALWVVLLALGEWAVSGL